MMRRCVVPALLLWLLAAGAASAGDRIEINHARALAGGISPSDTLGYPVTLSGGSYVLTSNLSVTDEAVDGIVVSGPVSLDLNGFTIAGPVTCTGSGAGLDCGSGSGGVGIDADNGAYGGVIVRNGTVRGFASQGIVLDEGCRIEDVTVVENRSAGVVVRPNCVVVGVIAARNGTQGLLATTGEGVVIRDSLVRGNKSYGILANSLATSVEACTAQGNGNAGIEIGPASIANYNASAQNSGAGISTAGTAVGTTLIKGNALYGNSGAGLQMVSFTGYVLNSSSTGYAGSGVALGSNQP